MSSLQTKLKDFKLMATKEKESNKELEKEFLMFKKEIVGYHEKELFKVVRQAMFFTEGLDLGLFDPFKDVKVSQFLDKEEIIDGEEDDGANV